MRRIQSVIQPVFFIGMGRSGTTIIFEALTGHKDLAWPSNYCEWFPGKVFMNALVPFMESTGLRGHKKQYGKALPGNRYLPQPDEAYRFWDYYTKENFSRSYLTNVAPSVATIQRVRNAVCRLMYWQGKQRFSAKFTGPGRLAYLASIFPDAHFVHIIRDGRAVVESLLRQKFWAEKGGLDKPFWNGTPEYIMNEWVSLGKHTDLLAAIQWRYIIESIRNDVEKLSNLSYMEVRYEDFISSPSSILKSIFQFSDLTIPDNFIHEETDNHLSYQNMNDKWKNYNEESIRRITLVMQPLLQGLGYV